MDTITLASEATADPHAGNRNLSTYPMWMAVVNVWDAMVCGARKYCEQEGLLTIYNMPHIVDITRACKNTDAHVSHVCVVV